MQSTLQRSIRTKFLKPPSSTHLSTTTSKMPPGSTQLQKLKDAYPWIQTPLIISAPMRIFTGPALANTVSRSGGIGFIGPGLSPSDLSTTLSSALKLAEEWYFEFASSSSSSSASPSSPQNPFTARRNQLPDSPPPRNSSDPKAPNDRTHLLPVGIGIQTFASDLSKTLEILSATDVFCPAAIWLFAARNGQREYDEWTQAIRAAKPAIHIWLQVGSVRDAISAALSAHPPDVLVLQGIDAGGHGLARGAGVISLVPEVASALREIGKGEIPLVAAGGIVDGRGVAAGLALGAVGAAMGTRFLGAEEAVVGWGYRGDVLRTRDGGQNTVRTRLYDELAGRGAWPEEYDGRNVVNRSWEDREDGVGMAVLRERYEVAKNRGEEGWGVEGRMTAYVGTGVGLVRKVEKGADIVEGVRAEVGVALRAASEKL